MVVCGGESSREAGYEYLMQILLFITDTAQSRGPRSSGVLNTD